MSASKPPCVLMCGLGWFPATIVGLDRYYRSLFEHLAEADGVVIGPASDAPARLRAVSHPHAPLPARLLAYRRAAAASDAQLLDLHFCLYGMGLRGGKPRVLHFHGPWALESVAAGDNSRVRGLARRLLERRVLRSARAHVVLSSAFRRVLVEGYRVSPWGVHVIPPGVELDRFTPGDRAQARSVLDLEETAFVVVCVRRLVQRMGVDVLLDAWREMPADSTLLVVGDGPLLGELTARAQGDVRFLGRISDEELLTAYRASDVAVVPSLSHEGFGMVVLEAAACGTPSIVSDVGGLPEAINGLDPSLVVNAGDPQALASRLQGILPAREASRGHAESFSWTVAADRHRRLYRDVLAGTRDERRRVVYLDHVARLSGGEIALLRLLPHLRTVNAHVILGEDGLFAERLMQAGISVEVLPLDASTRDLRRESARLGGASPRALLGTAVHVARLARRLRQLRPDVVHTNSLKSGVYGSLAAKAAGVPVVWHVRDRIADDYLPRTAVRAVRGLVGALADGVLANSTATMQTLRPPRGSRPYEVIPDSVEPPTESRSRPDGPLRFGMLGRIAPWKGQELFLRAFAASFPDGQEQAVLVGTPMFGEEDYEASLHALVDELGLQARVVFRGFRENIWEELARIDVLVHASLVPEPFGQVVLEGMAAGLAVIAADEGGPANVVEDGRTGRLFASRDEGSLMRAMRELAGDATARASLGAQAARAVDMYHPAALAERYDALYRRLLTR